MNDKKDIWDAITEYVNAQYKDEEPMTKRTVKMTVLFLIFLEICKIAFTFGVAALIVYTMAEVFHKVFMMKLVWIMFALLLCIRHEMQVLKK